MLDKVHEKPVCPDQDPEVKQAKTAFLAERLAVEAQRRNEANHMLLVTETDDVDRWRAQVAAPGLLSAMLETKANARERLVKYETIRKDRMKPIEQCWRQGHRESVMDLCDALTEASRKNGSVVSIIKQAGEEGVQFSVMSSLLNRRMPAFLITIRWIAPMQHRRRRILMRTWHDVAQGPRCRPARRVSTTACRPRGLWRRQW